MGGWGDDLGVEGCSRRRVIQSQPNGDDGCDGAVKISDRSID